MLKKPALIILVPLLILSPISSSGFSKGTSVGSFFVANATGHFYAIHEKDVYYFERSYSTYPDINSSWLELYAWEFDYALTETIDLDPFIDNSKYIVKNIDVHQNGSIYVLIGSGAFPGKPPYRVIGIEPINKTLSYNQEIDFTSEKGNLKELIVTDNFIGILMNEDDDQVRLYNHDGSESRILKLAPHGIDGDRGALLRTMAYDGEGLWLATSVSNSPRTNNEAVFYHFNISSGIQDKVINKNPDYPETMEIFGGAIAYVVTDRVDDGSINTLEAKVLYVSLDDAKQTTTPDGEINYPFSVSLISFISLILIQRAKKSID